MVRKLGKSEECVVVDFDYREPFVLFSYICACIKLQNLHAYNAKIPQKDNDRLRFLLLSSNVARKLGKREECVAAEF